MLDWKTPTIEDLPILRKIAAESGAMSCDAAPATIFLLRQKYETQIAIKDGFLFRSYRSFSLPGQRVITFPLGKGDPTSAMQDLIEDRKERNLPLTFITLTNEQMDWLKSVDSSFTFATNEGAWEYIYSAEHLAQLKGKENIKKRNRVNRFRREYPDSQVLFMEPFSENTAKNDSNNPSSTETLLTDLLSVEDAWLSEQKNLTESLHTERDEIEEAIRVWEELSLVGGVLYAENRPVAMTIASEISPGVFDIHFEKCFGAYAKAGGFAAINQAFSEYLFTRRKARWINREEDLGIPGLRKAKMAYRPDIRLQKYITVPSGTNAT